MKQSIITLSSLALALLLSNPVHCDDSGVDYVPGISPPIAMVPPPASCYAPGTPTHVIAANATRAQWNQLAISLAVDTTDPYTFPDSNRWFATATDGAGLNQGDPTTLTWGIVADGVMIPGHNGEPAAASTLRAFLDGIYGSSATWQPIFEEIFASWGQLTGIEYVYVTYDDGAAVGTSAGVLGVRPDLRIGGHPIDGNYGILAYNFYPDNGDMVIDVPDSFYQNTNNNSLGLRNVLAHEHGHGMGLRHVCPINETKLMEPYVTSAFDGPQHDDILAANRGYGDLNEHNDTAGTASDQGAPGSTTIDFAQLSIDDNSDADLFSFTVNVGAEIDVSIAPVGLTYLSGPQNSDGSCSAGTSYTSVDNLDLAIEVLDVDGSSVLDSADFNGAGLGELLNNVVLSSGAGTYFARVTGGSADEPQLYSMSLTLRDGPEAIFTDGFESGNTSAWQ